MTPDELIQLLRSGTMADLRTILTNLRDQHPEAYLALTACVIDVVADT